MKPITFIDCRFQEVAISIQEGQFSLAKDAEQNALQTILWVYRRIMAALFIPKVLVHYFMVLLHIARRPEPQLEKLKAELEQQQAIQKAQEHHRKTGGKTLGFMPGGKK